MNSDELRMLAEMDRLSEAELQSLSREELAKIRHLMLKALADRLRPELAGWPEPGLSASVGPAKAL